MNPFEKQLQLGRKLFELNASTLRRVVEQDAENFRKFMEINQSFFSRLPEAKDLSSFASLQREYGETVWSGAQQALKARGELLRESTGQAGELLRGAFARAEESAPPRPAAAA